MKYGALKAAQVQQHYHQHALTQALQSGEALVVEFEAEDKVLTIRHHIQRAAQHLGVRNLVIRRRG